MIEIHNAHIGFGDLGRGGLLGYDCPETGDQILIPDRYDDTISAHPPSMVDVTFTDAVSVMAACNASCFAPSIECYINWHHIGNLTLDIRRTPQIHLAPGRYRLRMQCESPAHGAHAVWLVTRDGARNDRVAIVAHTYYPECTLATKCSTLFGSAAKQGVLIHCAGVDERWEGFSPSKIVRTREHLRSIPETYRYLFVLDAGDTILLADEPELASVIGDRVSLGSETCSWPVRRPDWDAQFTDDDTPNCYINSGVIAGPREQVLRAYDLAYEVYMTCKERRAQGIIAAYQHWANDDQFIWQATYLENRDFLRRDSTCRLSANIGCFSGRLVDNPQATIDGRRIRSSYGTYPAVLHCCGPASNELQLWYRALVL